MNWWGGVAGATLGWWRRAGISYCLGLWFGRLLVVKWGRFFLIGEAKLERAERFVHRYEAGGIFFARLPPAVPHLISIPAGFIRINFRVFTAITLVASSLRTRILARCG